VLDAAAMHELTGSRHYVSGLYTPGTVMLQPAGYVRQFAAGLARGATVHEASPVTAFHREGSGWRVVTPRGEVAVGKVVMANNGHLESFGFRRGRLMHVFLFACMTEELDAEAKELSEAAADFADNSPVPDADALYKNVWAEENEHGRLYFDGRGRD